MYVFFFHFHFRQRTDKIVAVCSSITAHSSNFGGVVIFHVNRIMGRNTFKKTDPRVWAYNRVFVCHGSQPVSHSSNFGQVVICNATRIMASNIRK